MQNRWVDVLQTRKLSRLMGHALEDSEFLNQVRDSGSTLGEFWNTLLGNIPVNQSQALSCKLHSTCSTGFSEFSLFSFAIQRPEVP